MGTFDYDIKDISKDQYRCICYLEADNSLMLKVLEKSATKLKRLIDTKQSLENITNFVVPPGEKYAKFWRTLNYAAPKLMNMVEKDLNKFHNVHLKTAKAKKCIFKREKANEDWTIELHVKGIWHR